MILMNLYLAATFTFRKANSDRFDSIKKKSPFGDFLIFCRHSNSFAARRATTIQNIAATLGCHTRAKTMRADATCF
jgi:hypothetical protein